MAGVTTEARRTCAIDPAIEIWLLNGVLRIDNGHHVYEFEYAKITKIEFYEIPEREAT